MVGSAKAKKYCKQCFESKDNKEESEAFKDKSNEGLLNMVSTRGPQYSLSHAEGDKADRADHLCSNCDKSSPEVYDYLMKESIQAKYGVVCEESEIKFQRRPPKNDFVGEWD